jgi:anaerobic ribonucleoside-triphosphate reductase activating protein
MLPFTRASAMEVESLVEDVVATPRIDGVTFLGGEPFAQAGALAVVARAARDRGLSVLVFTGYTLEALRGARREDWGALLAWTDLLVDGRYEAGNPSPLRFVGSANQRLHALTPVGAALAREFETGPEIVEVRIDGAHVTVNGTPDRLDLQER